MVFIYLDIETFNEGVFKLSTAKIISIQYEDSQNHKLIILKEWIDGEKRILEKFYEYIISLTQTEKSVTIIGHNLLRFDIPLLIQRIAINGIANYETLIDLFHNMFVIDLLQCLLPFNDFKFKGLNSVELSKRFDIREPIHLSKDIIEFYPKKQYTEIEEHISGDIDFTKDLYWALKDKEKMRNLVKTVFFQL